MLACSYVRFSAGTVLSVDLCVGVVTKDVPLSSPACLFYALVTERPPPPPRPPSPHGPPAQPDSPVPGKPQAAAGGWAAGDWLGSKPGGRRLSWTRQSSIARCLSQSMSSASRRASESLSAYPSQSE